MKFLVTPLLLMLAFSVSFHANAQHRVTIEDVRNYSYEQKRATYNSLISTIDDQKQEHVRKNRELIPFNFNSASTEKLNLALEHLKKSKLENLEMLLVAKEADIYAKALKISGDDEHERRIIQSDQWIERRIVSIEGILKSRQ